MRKIIRFFIFILILIILLFLVLFIPDTYLYFKTGCNIKWGGMGIYSDYLVCNNEYITEGVINYKFIPDGLLIFSVKIEDRFPKLCFTDRKIVYLYNSKKNNYTTLSNFEIIDISQKYNIKEDFYKFPEQYVNKYMNNCNK